LRSAGGRAGLEDGQAIILIVAGLVGLLAATGLAIDGGRLLLLRRDLQNASDAAVVAATRAVCLPWLGLDPVAEGHAASEANGFNDADPETVVTVDNPLSVDPGEGDNWYARVEITSRIPGSLIQLVYAGPLQATASGVARCIPSPPYGGPPYAVCANSETCGDDTLDWAGNNNSITGDLHSNDSFVRRHNNGSVTGQGSYVDSYSNLGSNNTYNGDPPGPSNPSSGPVRDCMESFPHTIDDFGPGGTYGNGANYHNAGGSTIDQAWLSSQGLLAGTIMTDGTYYTTGSINLNINDLSGNVTLVAEGSISLSGNNQSLTPYVQNVLMFSNHGGFGCTTTAIRTEGQNNYWRGLVYAPEGRIETSGQMNGTLFEACLMANTVLLNGENLNLQCLGELFPPGPPTIELIQ
jgi:hypothetical protein